jgi:hypothetical protein
MMRLLMIAVFVMGIPCVCSAQSNNLPWANLSTLQPGLKIQVVQMNSKKNSGTFVDVSDTGILLKKKSGEETIQKSKMFAP